MTKYSLSKADLDELELTKLQDYGTERLALKDIFSKLIDGKTIVIPHYEQSLGGDVYVKLSDDAYPHTLIGMYTSKSGPSTWQSYSITIDALSTFPCYEFTKSQQAVAGTTKVLSNGTFIRYVNSEGNRVTSSITGAYFLAKEDETPEVTTTTTTTTMPDGSNMSPKDDLTGKNTVILPDGTQARLDYRFDTSIGMLMSINQGYDDTYTTVPESEYVDYTVNSTSTEEPEKDTSVGLILYTLDNEDGYFGIVATQDPIVPDSGYTITLEG